MQGQKLYREILVTLLLDTVEAREAAQRAEARARDYLRRHKTLKVSYDEFIKNGGGSLDELKDWLATRRPLPTLAQKKYLSLVVANPQH
jgi:hypothetical protein